MIRLIMTVVIVLIFALGMRKPKLVPRGFQNLVEMMMDFVRVNIAEEILGKKNARKYFPFIATIFFLVFFLNLTSVIPFMNISSNGRIAMPLVLALLGWVVYIAVGIKRHGAGKYFKSSLIMPGVPWPMHLLLVPIEFVSTFILRPFSLTIRLMANMLAGHIMLALFFIATQYFFFSASGGMKVFGVGSLLVAIGFTFFELLVVLLQAYIFALLVAVYIDSSIHADDH